MKIRPVGAKLFHVDGWTDMKKLIVAFRNFAKAPKKDGVKWQGDLYQQAVETSYIALSEALMPLQHENCIQAHK